jgi:hypothetical protein
LLRPVLFLLATLMGLAILVAGVPLGVGHAQEPTVEHAGHHAHGAPSEDAAAVPQSGMDCCATAVCAAMAQAESLGWSRAPLLSAPVVLACADHELAARSVMPLLRPPRAFS